MQGINKAIIVGTLGGDPNVNYTDNGICVANLSVATNEIYQKKDSDEKVTTTEWHKVVFFRGLAEVAEKYLKKGSRVYIEGKLKTRKWTDKNEIDRYTTEIYGDSLQMLDSKPDSGQQKAEQQASQYNPLADQAEPGKGTDSEPSPVEEDDDLPF